jgi:pimeloyl-ACP methyl ester carboxylesterase
VRRRANLYIKLSKVASASLLVVASLTARAFAEPSNAPVVFLIPGAASSGDRLWIDNFNWSLPILGGTRYFGVLSELLKLEGIRSEICSSDEDEDTRTLSERADQCVKQILAIQPEGICRPHSARNAILFGHSMGGLVARLVASDPRVKDCVHSVTTISTPHKGTPIADFGIDRAQRDDESFSFFGKLVKLARFTPERRRYLPELRLIRTGYSADVFKAQDTPDNPDIRYYSFTNSTSQPALKFFYVSKDIIESQLKELALDPSIFGPFGTKDDGVAPEYSMVYGQVLGHLEVDHATAPCTDLARQTEGCELALKAIVPHLKKLWMGGY